MKPWKMLWIFCLCLVSPVLAQNPFDDDAVVPVKPAVAVAAAKESAPPLNGSSDEAIEYYAKKHADPDVAWEESLQDRNQIDPKNIPLRDAEHYWWARAQVQNSPWYLKPYKWFQQTLCTLGYSGYKLARSPFVDNTTPPSLREIKYGLKGAWEGAFSPSSPNR